MNIQSAVSLAKFEKILQVKCTPFIVNSVAIYKAQLLNQAAFFWSTYQTCEICTGNFFPLVQNSELCIFLFCSLNFAGQQ